MFKITMIKIAALPSTETKSNRNVVEGKGLVQRGGFYDNYYWRVADKWLAVV